MESTTWVDFAALLFAISAAILGGANIVIIASRFVRHDELAKAVSRAFSEIIWLFLLGGRDGGVHRKHRAP